MELIGTITPKGGLTGFFDHDITDYNLLTNKPQINGETLIGDKSAADLGLQSKITFPLDPTKYLDGEGNFTTPPSIGNYNDLTNKPQINGVTLTENKTGDDLDLSNKAHFTELSGSVVSFPDGQDLPLAKCLVDINPIQDLHGYDKPWAPGVGKNKLKITTTTITENGVLFTINTDSGGNVISIVCNGTPTLGNASLKIGINEAVGNNSILSGAPSGGSLTTFLLYIDGTTIYDLGNGVNIPNTETHTDIAISIRSGYTANNLTFYPMIRFSTEPSGFEPYSNICPISPRTEVNITVSATEGGAGEDTQIALGRNVYGGTLNVKTGEIIVDRGYREFDGTETQWNIGATNISLNISDMNFGNNMDGLCSIMGKGSSSGQIRFGLNNTNIYIVGGVTAYDLDTLAKVQAFTTGMQIVYPLATPLTYTLTPSEVRSILGQNYIGADTGDIDIIYINNVNDPAIAFILNNL